MIRSKQDEARRQGTPSPAAPALPAPADEHQGTAGLTPPVCRPHPRVAWAVCCTVEGFVGVLTKSWISDIPGLEIGPGRTEGAAGSWPQPSTACHGCGALRSALTRGLRFTCFWERQGAGALGGPNVLSLGTGSGAGGSQARQDLGLCVFSANMPPKSPLRVSKI